MPKLAVVKQSALSLYPIAYPDAPEQDFEVFQDETDYTFISFATGEQLVAKKSTDTDTFTFYLVTNSFNGAPDRLSIAVYTLTTQDLEYSQANLVYNVISYPSANDITYNTYYGYNYLDFFSNKADLAASRLTTSTAVYSLAVFNSLYDVGFNDGKIAGIEEILNEPSLVNLYTQESLDIATNEAYTDGIAYANSQNEQFNLRTLIFAIFEAPSHLLDMFNFEIFGVNFKLIVTFLISIALVLFVIGIFKRG